MAYAVVRPSGQPYKTSAYMSAVADQVWNPMYIDVGTIGGGGSLADNSDSSYVEVYSSNWSEQGMNRTDVVAVDFAPVPALTDATSFGAWARYLENDADGSGSFTNFWHLVRTSTGQILGFAGRFVDFGSAPATPETRQTTSDNFYWFEAGAHDIIRNEGFTVVFFGDAGNTDYSTEGDVIRLRLFEFGLRFDLAALTRHIRPCRRFPRG